MSKMKAYGPEKNERVREAPYRMAEGGVILQLRVQPGAAHTEITGTYGQSALRLRVAAPATDGKANRACIRFLAQAMGVPPSAVSLLRGVTSRDKTVRIAPVDEGKVRALLSRWGVP